MTPATGERAKKWTKKPIKSVEKPPKKKKKKKKKGKGRRNMRAAERERFIVDEAVKFFFAEHGFGGQTRELAKRMGITHSAIYRHFPSKEALIEPMKTTDLSLLLVAVLLAGPLISDCNVVLAAGPAVALQSRICRAGLRIQLGEKFLRLLRDEIVRHHQTVSSDRPSGTNHRARACCELRHELKLPSSDQALPLSGSAKSKCSGVCTAASSIWPSGVSSTTRRHRSELDDIVRDAVQTFMDGAKTTMPRLLARD